MKTIFSVFESNADMGTQVVSSYSALASAAAGFEIASSAWRIALAFAGSMLLLLGSSAGHGQDGSQFSLFEPVDSSGPVSSTPGRRNSRTDADISASEGEFALIGTARIGNKVSALLRHVSGEAVRVPLEHSRVPIPGYEQYVVISYSGESISIQYPQSVACVEFVSQGIRCDASRNVAELDLTMTTAIKPTTDQTNTLQSESEQDQGVPTNPFEALRNRTQNGELPAGRPDRFQPRRIDPEDVPPGMRVVSTPFGDRLVEE
jgi:hypothetical protein